jgi:hypothetical protein
LPGLNSRLQDDKVSKFQAKTGTRSPFGTT